MEINFIIPFRDLLFMRFIRFTKSHRMTIHIKRNNFNFCWMEAIMVINSKGNVHFSDLILAIYLLISLTSITFFLLALVMIM
jgi:hypothetical protein